MIGTRLCPRQYAAVLRRDLGQNLQRLIERLRYVTDEGRRLACGKTFRRASRLIICIQTINGGPGLSTPLPRRPYSKALPQHFHSNRQIPILIGQYRVALSGVGNADFETNCSRLSGGRHAGERAGASRPGKTADKVSFYFAAHEDDWQLFMNPSAFQDVINRRRQDCLRASHRR